jgi:two-component system LytT family sensor kinase
MTQPEHERSSRKSMWTDWKTWVILAGVSITLNFVGFLNRYVVAAAVGTRFPLGGEFWRELPVYLISMPSVPIVWFLANRFRLDRPRWRPNALLHVVAAILVAYLMIVETRFILLVEDSLHLLSNWQNLTELARSSDWERYNAHFMMHWVWYWAVVGVFYALTFHNESQQRLTTAAQLQANLVSARLQALRCQLNPHFLFNTLGAISGLALRGEREAAVDMIERLAHLLRLALDDARPDTIALQDELQFIDRYLEIQHIRFGDLLATRSDVAPDTLLASVPAMILQPVVENAIKHCVSVSTGRSTVVIHASRHGDTLRLRVSDTGRGFEVSAPRPTGNGIGLSNTEARLEQLYGPAHRIEYVDGTDGGVSVTISIPFSEAESVTFSSRQKAVQC